MRCLCAGLVAGAVCTAFALSHVPSLTAQQTPAPKWSLVTLTTIKPDSRADYEAWQKDITAAYKKAEVPSRAVLQTMMGDLFEYISVSPLAHFADMDGASPVERALGKDGAAVFMKKGAPYVVSVRRMATLAMDDLSIRTKTPEMSPYAMVTSMHIIPGKASDFDAYMKNDYLPVMKKGEVKNFWVSRTVFGGDPNERVTARLMKNLAEIDAGPLTTKILGQEGARKLTSKTAGIVDAVQYRIVRYRPDLSYELGAGSQSTASLR
jgi:hypothetical protein